MDVGDTGKVSQELADRAYDLMLRLGADEANRYHFVNKWMSAPPGRFGYHLVATPYTFYDEDGHLRVTTYLTGDEYRQLAIDVGTELAELRTQRAA